MTATTVTTGGLSSSPIKGHGVNGNELSHSTSPVSLPSWVSGGEKRSVREMAASLARHQTMEETTNNKKSDSLPRNSTPPNAATTTPSVLEQPQDFNRARVSIQEWSRNHDLWKVPLRKLSGENNRPVSKRWEPNNSDKTGTNGHDVSILRRVSKEEEIVNV
jgi:hypothetical protein